MNPQVFGWEHIVYLAVMLTLCVVATVLIKKFATTERALAIAVKSVAGLLLAAVVWNRIVIAVKYGSAIELIPSTFCGMSSIALSLCVLIGKKNNSFLHFICYIGFIGGLLTVVYPDFIGQSDSIFYPATFSGLLHHTLIAYLVVLMVLTRYFVPTLKKWQWLPLGLCCFVTFGEFEISAFGFADAMYLHTPLLEGTIFTWWFTGILVLALSYATMAIFDYFNVFRPAARAKQIAEENAGEAEETNSVTETEDAASPAHIRSETH